MWRWFLDGHWVLLEFFMVFFIRLICNPQKMAYSKCSRIQLGA
jgi:hypothetical protein